MASSKPAKSAPLVSMLDNHFRWMLMWQGDINRELALLEVERYGLRRARQTMRKLHARRRAFLKSIEPHR